MFNQAYLKMCIEQGGVTGDASFVDALFMLCLYDGIDL